MVIGTRGSELALWQARLVIEKLKSLKTKTDIKIIQSKGDKNPDQAISTLGQTGVFTKALDDALLSEEVDVAVHSMKDYPTNLHPGLYIGAILEREKSHDIVIPHPKKNISDLEQINEIATGSMRRKAQWLNQYPEAKIIDIRGNVPTRINKLKESNWDAIILAYAGVKRLNLDNDLKMFETDWMIPAPAQGTIVVTCRSNDLKTIKILKTIEDQESAIIVDIERTFLNALEGGCSMPIGALATLHRNRIRFQAGLYTPDGTQSYVIDKQCDLKNVHENLNLWIEEFKSNNVHKLLKNGSLTNY